MTVRELSHLPVFGGGGQAAPARAVTTAARPVSIVGGGPAAPLPMQSALPAGVRDVTPGRFGGGATGMYRGGMVNGLPAGVRDVTPGGGGPGPSSGCGGCSGAREGACACGGKCNGCSCEKHTGMALRSALPAGVRDVTPGARRDPGLNVGCAGCSGASGGACACGNTCDGCSAERSGQCGGGCCGGSSKGLEEGHPLQFPWAEECPPGTMRIWVRRRFTRDEALCVLRALQSATANSVGLNWDMSYTCTRLYEIHRSWTSRFWDLVGQYLINHCRSLRAHREEVHTALFNNYVSPWRAARRIRS